MANVNEPAEFDDDDSDGIAELKAELEALKAKPVTNQQEG